MNDRDLIDRLGGGTRLAQLLAEKTGQPIDREAIYKWKERGVIPWRWRSAVSSLAVESEAA